MTPFIVKICGVTTIEDARMSLEAGANAIGFNFYPASSRYLSPDRFARIAAAVTGDYLRVGVFVNPSLEQLTAVPLDIVQIYGRLPGSLPPGLRLWKAINPSKLSTEVPADGVEAYLLDTPSPRYGGTGIAFDWREAIGFPGRFILAGGLHSGNVEEAVRVTRPWGVDACSRIESSPGRKDPELVRAFVAAAHRAANSQPEPATKAS